MSRQFEISEDGSRFQLKSDFVASKRQHPQNRKKRQTKSPSDRLHQAGNTAARPRQARDDAGADRIDGLREHDRHAAARSLYRLDESGADAEDHVRRQRDKFRGLLAIALAIARAPTMIDPQVAADAPAPLLQSLLEGRQIELCFRIVGGG
jgi:hypothetical protein